MTVTNASATVSAALADFVVGVAVPDDVVTVARRSLATAIPLAAGAADTEAPRRVRTVVQRIGSPASATILGTNLRAGASLAALVNGTAANSDDFDDSDLVTLSHPTAAVVPAALAAAEFADASSETLVRAVAVGLEVGMRVARALGSAHAHDGWHISSTSGQLAAGAATASALGLDREQTVATLGLAATQMAGLGRALGTMTKPFHFGKAASNGVEAALLVRAGLTAPAAGIEGRRGAFAVVASHADPDELARDLGSRWLALEVMPKPYPCGVVGHAAVDSAVDAAARVDAAAVTAIHAHVHASCLDLMGNPEPRTALEAKLSLPHCIAAGLVRGRLGLAEFDDDAVTDPEVAALRRRVVLVATDRPMESARLVVDAGGGQIESETSHARGTMSRPLSDDEVAAKGVEAAARTIGVDGARRLVDACLGRVTVAGARELAALGAHTH